MSGRPHPDLVTLAAAAACQIDDICDRFEAAWKAANETTPRPVIEAFLGDTAEPARTPLLGELLRLDVYYRQRLGETPRAEDYATRFPSIASAFVVRTATIPFS
jgi:hypothetical protein